MAQRTTTLLSFICTQPDKALHAMAFRFQRMWWEGTLSERQEWLWERICAELRRRRRATRPIWRRCTCAMCFDPWPTDLGEEEPF